MKTLNSDGTIEIKNTNESLHQIAYALGEFQRSGGSMEFEIMFDHMPEYVLIRTYGEASVHGFDDLLATLVNSLEWVDGTKQLVDHRKLSGEYLTTDNVKKIVDISKKYGEQLAGGRVAFVVSDAESFGLVRMYELLGGESTHNEILVFYSIDEAIAWLKQ